MNQLITLFIAYIPSLIGAIAIVIVGAILAVLVRRATMFVLTRIGFDALCERVQLTPLLRQSGISRTPSNLAATLLFYAVLLLSILAALGPLGLDFLATSLNQIVLFLPRAITAIAILILGTSAAGVLAQLTETALENIGLRSVSGITTFLRIAIMFVAAILAAAVLQIDVTILIVITVIGLGGVALTAALAIGLGLRPLSQNIAASRYISEGVTEGDRITINGIGGTVEQIGHAVTTIRHPDGRTYLVPNSLFLEHVVEKAAPSSDESAAI